MIRPQIRNYSEGPEAKIKRDFCENYLRPRGWYWMHTHGNMYQAGFPDTYATHKDFGIRWIEFKNHAKWAFTAAQKKCFPVFVSHGTGIWIVDNADWDNYNRLFRPANYVEFMLRGS